MQTVSGDSRIIISIILPIPSDRLDLAPILEHLWQQPADFELVIVTPSGIEIELPAIELQLKLIESRDTARGELLNAGAAAADGDVLLFLWPDNRLPVEALLTIEKNFALLPQTIGGNFHLIFDKDTFLTRTTKNFIARQRYQGYYFGNSGIYVKRDVFETLGGFQPLNFLEDFDFGQRLEAVGPTLYLPDKIFASAEKFGLGSAVVWAVVIMLQKVGASPVTLARVARSLGWR